LYSFANYSYNTELLNIKPMKLLITIALLTVVLAVSAQPPGGGRGGERGGRGGKMNYASMPAIGTVSGFVLDSLTSEAIQFATIRIYLARKDSLVGGGVTDEKGYFKISEVRPGPHYLKIDFIGYHEKKSFRFMLKPSNLVHDIGKFQLLPDQSMLDQAEITTEKKFMQSSFDKKIYNVSQLISSESGSASEILEAIPSVQVDIDGNISLRGSGNVTILIDGKPSSLTGFDRAAILEQIPASSIDRIEVITNPSAKYDPDGMAGILNVVLKKDKKQGFNGAISGGYSGNYNYDKLWGGLNGSANINYRRSKLNLYANYGHRSSDSWRENVSFRETFFDDSLPFLDQYSFGGRSRESHLIKGGFDYDFNEFNVLSVSGNYSIKLSGSTNDKTYKELDPSETLQNLFVRESESIKNSDSYDIGLNHTKKFRKANQELVLQANYSHAEGIDQTDIQEIYFETDSNLLAIEPYLQNNWTNSNSQIITLQADFTTSYKKKGKVEFGYKSILRDINNDFNSETFDSVESVYISDTLLNNNFLYKEDVHALYGTFGNEWKKWKYQFGLRAEMVDMESQLVTTNENFKNPYTSLFPSGNLAYGINEKTEIQVSYSRRIHRPSMRSVNPFTNFSDPANIRVGNPFLRPEYINSYELGFMKYSKKNTFSSSLFFKQTNDVITRLRSVDTSGVGTLTYFNINKAYNYGLELVFITNVKKWLNINSSFTFTQNILDGSNVESDLNIAGITYFGRVMATFKVNKQFSIQASAKYFSGFVSLQGTSGPFTSADLMAKYSFWQNKASFSLRLKDAFNTRQFSYSSVGTGFTQEFSNKRMSRTLNITFSYRFGKMESKRKKRGDRGGRPEDSGGSRDDLDM
jgi:iron complex outermembrane receptor protein